MIKITGIVGSSLPRFAQHVQTRTAGKFQIGENQQIAPPAHFVDGRISVRSFFHGVARALQRLAEHRAQLGFIFDQEDWFHEAEFLARPAGIAACPLQLIFGVGDGLLVGLDVFFLGFDLVRFSC